MRGREGEQEYKTRIDTDSYLPENRFYIKNSRVNLGNIVVIKLNYTIIKKLNTFVIIKLHFWRKKSN